MLLVVNLSLIVIAVLIFYNFITILLHHVYGTRMTRKSDHNILL